MLLEQEKQRLGSTAFTCVVFFSICVCCCQQRLLWDHMGLQCSRLPELSHGGLQTMGVLGDCDATRRLFEERAETSREHSL